MAWDIGQTQSIARADHCHIPVIDMPPPPSTVLEMTSTDWPERVTADRYQPSDPNLITAVFG